MTRDEIAEHRDCIWRWKLEIYRLMRRYRYDTPFAGTFIRHGIKYLIYHNRALRGV